MKPDERKFLDETQRRTRLWKKGEADMPYPRRLARELGINEKRAAYICDKWAGKDWYDYGVNVLAGWLTGKGESA
jgi:hypothetical protein